MRSLPTFLAICIAGCTTPLGYTEKPLHRYDRDTTYRVDDFSGGFTVTAYYSRFQFMPESSAVSEAGRHALMNIAYDVAEDRGRKIQPLNEQRVRMSMGRNGLTGVSSWSGSIKVFYR